MWCVVIGSLALAGIPLSGCGGDQPSRRSYTPPQDRPAQPPPPAPPPAQDIPAETGQADVQATTDPSPQTPGDETAAASPPPGEGPDAGQPAGEGESGEKANPPPGSPAQDQSPEKPPRPDDVADWKLEDYFSARQEGDGRLEEAVGHLGARFRGDPRAPSVARMLGELLKPVEEEQTPGDSGNTPRPYTRHQTRRSDPKLIEALVAALGANGSDEARQILGQILDGTLPTDDDKTAVSAALRALADHPSAENEALLFRALVEAEKLGPNPEGGMTAEEIRQETLGLVASSASMEFRTKLAQHLLAPTTGPQHRELLGGFLEENHPNNLGAQLLLYQGAETPKDKKATFERYFTEYGSRAMATVLGLSTEDTASLEGSSARPNAAWRPGSGRASSGGSSVDTATAEDSAEARADLGYHLARQLWAQPCVAMVEQGLGSVESLSQQAQLVLLASTIPVNTTRAALWKHLEKHWEDGPQELEAAGLTAKVVSDPGLLLTIKSLPRKERPDPAASTRTKSYSSGRRSSYDSGRSGRRSSSDTSRSSTLADRAAKREEAAQQWMKTSEDLLAFWCARFYAAAMARPQAAPSPAAAPAAGEVVAKLPIEIHEGAPVIAEYQVNWPGDLRGKPELAGVHPGPMEVRYVRIEETADPTSRIGYYRRQLRLRDARTIETGAWLDSLRSVPRTDRKRSIDVRITWESGAGEEKPDEGETKLTIEILSVEMQDPAQA